MKAFAWIFASFGALVSTIGAAMAAQPTDWQMWHQPAGSQMMADIDWFDKYTFWFITPITIFVMILLLIVMVRFSAKANPTPSKTTHNTFIEFVWTVAPIIILIMIALPSFNLLNSQFDPGEEPTVTVKAVGQQWYWEYEYQDEGGELVFDSRIIGSKVIAGSEEAAQKERVDLGKTDINEYPNLLVVDNELVVPVGETIRVLVTAEASGVIHNFAMPAFGLKMDAVPGRTNETWFKAEREGLYYGQCSELCGVYHAYMPIGIRVVSRAQYDAWRAAAVEDVTNANNALTASVEADKNIKLAGN